MKMAIVRHIPDDTSDFVQSLIVLNKRLAHRAFTRKELLCAFFRNHHRVGMLKGGGRISLDKRDGENIEYIIVRVNRARLHDRFCFAPELEWAHVPETRGGLYFGKFPHESFRHGRRQGSIVCTCACHLQVPINPHDPVCIYVEPVITYFKSKIEEYHQAGCEAYGEPKYVDECIEPGFFKIANCNDEEIPEHDFTKLPR